MPSKERSSVISSAKVFIISVCILCTTVAVWNNYRARESQLREARSTVSNISKALAQHAEDTFKQADFTLTNIAEMLAEDGNGPAAVARLERSLIRQVAEMSQINGLFVVDKDGAWTASSGRRPDTIRSSVDREYFLYHRSHTGTLPHIGQPIKSRATGQWVVPVSRRISSPDGSFNGVVMVAIKLDYFSQFYDSFDIGEDGAMMLALDEGMILTRRPLRTDTIGKDIRGTELYRDHASKNASGIATVWSTQDSKERINSYVHLSRYPVFVSAALSKEEVLAHWKTGVVLRIGILLVLLAALAFFGKRLVGQIRRRVDAEHEAIENRAYVEHLNQTLQGLVMHDGLTGLANRRCFDVEIAKELRRAARNRKPLSLIMIDVDCFKLYNDANGHLAGDDCLRKIGAAVKLAVKRPGDLVARYGGEELVVMLPDCDGPGALQVANEILIAVHALGVLHAGNAHGVVTASAGVGVLDSVGSEDTLEKIVGMADKALYQAKLSGRNKACLYGVL